MAKQEYAGIGFNFEDIEYLANMIEPKIKAGARNERKKMAYASFVKDLEALQDHVGDDRVEARYRARYVSKAVYEAADYKAKPSQFKKILNTNLEKAGYTAGQKGAQTTVEHSIPRTQLFHNLIDMWKERYGLTTKEIAEYIYNHNTVAVITYEEDAIITSKGYREYTPNINDKFARYTECGIKIIDVQTGQEVN